MRTLHRGTRRGGILILCPPQAGVSIGTPDRFDFTGRREYIYRRGKVSSTGDSGRRGGMNFLCRAAVSVSLPSLRRRSGKNILRDRTCAHRTFIRRGHGDRSVVGTLRGAGARDALRRPPRVQQETPCDVPSGKLPCGAASGFPWPRRSAAAVFFLEGSAKGLEFITGYVIEWSLSVDNLFVFIVIFRYFAVPPAFQHRVLF